MFPAAQENYGIADVLLQTEEPSAKSYGRTREHAWIKDERSIGTPQIKLAGESQFVLKLPLHPEDLKGRTNGFL